MTISWGSNSLFKGGFNLVFVIGHLLYTSWVKRRIFENPHKGYQKWYQKANFKIVFFRDAFLAFLRSTFLCPGVSFFSTLPFFRVCCGWYKGFGLSYVATRYIFILLPVYSYTCVLVPVYSYLCTDSWSRILLDRRRSRPAGQLPRQSRAFFSSSVI